MKSVKVVGAVIRNEENHILCALRSPNMSMPNLWEFPGGKIEEGESPQASLLREIKEELDCTIEVLDFITEVQHPYPNILVHLLTYEARIIDGIPQAKEHARLEWISLTKLKELEWAPADIPTVEILLKKPTF